MINNMQQLHECCDSRDNHFAKNQIRLRGFDTVPFNINQDSVAQENDDELYSTLDVLLNLQYIQGLSSKWTAAEMRESILTIDILHRAGFLINDDTLNSYLMCEHTQSLDPFVVNIMNNDEL